MTYEEFRSRVHQRVCVSALACTCPTEVTPAVIAEAREQALHVHAKFDHGGDAQDCKSPHDVICKEVWS